MATTVFDKQMAQQKVSVGLFTSQFTGGIFADFGKIASLARECVCALFLAFFHAASPASTALFRRLR